MALFISFEGGEGSGKSTQAARLVQALKDTGVSTQFIHEPGTTNLGLHIRELIKGNPWGQGDYIPRSGVIPVFGRKSRACSEGAIQTC